jgi:hypothetical protein
MRMFVLHRQVDESGVSGVGTVAEGVEFSDLTVVIRWITGEHQSTVLWNSVEDVKAIHGHDGKTKLLFADGAP